MSMDTNSNSKQATPSPAGVYPKASLFSSSGSSSSVPIRAPPTIDSDFEYSLSCNPQKHSTSSYGSDYSGFESEGFVSGEDEFETASERPYVADPDAETVELSSVDEEYDTSRPFVTDPNGETLEKSGFHDEYVVSRPFVTDPDDEIVIESSHVEKYAVSRPFVENSDEEEKVTIEESSHVEQFVVSMPFVEPAVTDFGILSLPKSGMPIAQLSGDSDYDSMGSEVEDDQFSGIVRIPSSGIVETDIIAPKVKVLGLDEGEADELQFEESFSGEEVMNGVLVSDEKKGTAEKDTVKDSISAELVEDKGLDFNEAAKAECLVAVKDYSLLENLELDEDVKHPVEEVQAFEDAELEKHINETYTVESESAYLGDNDSLKLDSTTHIVQPNLQEMEVEIPEVDKNFNFGAVLVDIDSCGNHSVDVNEGVVLSQGSDNEKLQSAVEQITNQGVDSHDSVISNTLEPSSLNSNSGPELKVEDKDEADCVLEELAEEDEGSLADGNAEDLIFGDSETVKQIIGEFEQRFTPNSLSGGESSQNHSQRIDGQIVSGLDEEVDTVGESEGKEIFGTAALAALLKAAAGAGGLSSTFRSLRPTPQPNSPNLFTPSELSARVESEEIVNEEEEKRLEKIQQIQVKFLRLVHKLGLSTEDSIAAQVLSRLALASGRPSASTQSFILPSAIRAAMEIESEGKKELNLSLNILVIGKTGAGKSATINSVFGENKALTNAFDPATTTVKEIVGKIDGVEVRVVDTPGLRSSLTDQSYNRKILLSIKRFTKKCPPDVVLYVDRVDTQTRDFNDLPLLRSITSSLGPSVWRNCIITLTHAASTPADGPSGSPLSYDVFVSQQSRFIQQLISHAAGDMQMMNPVSLVENHPFCKKDGNGQMLLPNGKSWRPQLLLLCYSMKILSEANSLVKTPHSLDHSKLFGFGGRLLPLPYFLTSLLQSFAHPKITPNLNSEGVDSDIELGCLTDSDQEDEDEYDQLPPFKPLSKLQIAKLSKEQHKAYFEEYDYRVKLLQKKQWREHVKRLKEMKKGKDDGKDYGYVEEDGDYETGGPADVGVPLPDVAIPPSFDGDNPSYRYRFLEPSSQLLTMPVPDAHGWDHDFGYDGVSLEQTLAIANRFPAVISVKITKDKKEFNIHMDSAVSAKHGENGSSMAGLDIQTMGKQLAYILKGETKMKNFKINKTAAGFSVIFLGENVVPGFKIEDQVAVGKWLVLVGSTGVTRSKGDSAYGVNLEMRVREKDFPLGQDGSTLGASLVRWRGDFVWVCNMKSQFSVGRSSKMALHAGLNNRLNGQISVRIITSEQLQIAILGLLPIANTICRSIFPQLSERY